MDEKVADLHESLVQLAEELTEQIALATAALLHIHQNAISNVIYAQTNELFIEISHQLLELLFVHIIFTAHDHRLIQAAIEAHHEEQLFIPDIENLKSGKIATGYLRLGNEGKLIGLAR